MFDAQNGQTTKSFHASAHVIAAFLTKLAKHLAFIASLMIIRGSTGRFAESQLEIFLTVAAAAVLHSAGLFLKRRVSRSRLPRFYS